MNESLANEHSGPDIWQNLVFAVGAGLLAAGIPSPVTAVAAAATWGLAAPNIRDPAIFSAAAEGWRDLQESLIGADGVTEKITQDLEDVKRAWEGDAADAFLDYMEKFKGNVESIAGAADSAAGACDTAFTTLLMANIGYIVTAIGVTAACLIASANIDGGAIAKSTILSAYIPAVLAIVTAIVSTMVALGTSATSMEGVIRNGGNLFSGDQAKIDAATSPHVDDLELISDISGWDRTKTEED